MAHRCSCKHEHVKYCPACGVCYCEDCGREWFDGEVSNDCTYAVADSIVFSDIEPSLVMPIYVYGD